MVFRKYPEEEILQGIFLRFGYLYRSLTEESDSHLCRVIIWNSISDAVSERAEETKKSMAILGEGVSHYSVYDVRNADPTNTAFDLVDDTLGIQSENTFYNPFYLCYDGTYLWVGDFKFSGGIKRFTGQ